MELQVLRAVASWRQA
ncbi:hypothetical protein A2U01_0061295, partial [Trifolium medium]|nr:hypothetical protein [Trifolium medium]